MKIKIRKAAASDLESVHHMVKQLAAFERAPEQVLTTPETYKKDFADKNFEILLAEDEETDSLRGMAFYFFAYSTWKGKFIWLEDLVVDEPFRGMGIGKLLFDAVVEECKRSGVRQLKWQVLDWNENAIRFYKKYNAVCDEGWLTYKLMMI